MPLDPARKLHNYKPAYKAPGSIYKPAFADAAVLFINQLRHTKSPFRGVPFELIDWQEQIIKDIFGIVDRRTECRQTRVAYIELPKKNGKSELAAAVALLLTCCDHEYGGEIYGCATDRQQAGIVFDVAAAMVDQNPTLKKLFKFNPTQKRLTFKPLDSYYQAVSADFGNKDGLNAHGIIFDELHAQKNRAFYDVMTSGSGLTRQQPLTFIITTAGYSRESICWEMHQKAEAHIRNRTDPDPSFLPDPAFYPVIYSADDEKDDWKDPEVWRRVNPSYGITINPVGFRAEFDKAQSNPVDENTFRRLNLNQWVKQSVRWMPMDLWDACNFEIDMPMLKNRACYGGLDLSSTQDLTALVLCFPPEDEEDKYILLPFFWIPEETIQEHGLKDNVNYDKWQAQGHLEVTDGAVINYRYIEQKIKYLRDVKQYKIREIAFDRWGSHLLSQNLDEAGFRVAGFGQGFKSMSPPSKELMDLVIQQRIAHGGHPVLRWCFNNVVMKGDEAGNIKPIKEKNSQKIDGAVASIMALDRAIKREGRSVYETRGVLMLDRRGGFHYTA